MAGGVEEPEGDAAVDTAAEKYCDSEALVRHGATEIRLEINMEGGGRGGGERVTGSKCRGGGQRREEV